MTIAQSALGFYVAAPGVWKADWAWGVPLIILTVVIHAIGLGFINRSAVGVYGRRTNGRYSTALFAVLSNAELQRFKGRLALVDEPHRVALTSATPNFSLWSERRIKDYQASLATHFAPAIAILRIPKIRVEVPVLEGTDDLSLNRGVGHVTGTANPGENGNMAIAGHRDGFFRGLKDVGLGDTIEMVTLGRIDTYVIDRIIIVERNDISVLAPTPRPSLTLVTCYPFYFIGSAPKRYIVQASVADFASANARPSWHAQSMAGSVNQQANAR